MSNQVNNRPRSTGVSKGSGGLGGYKNAMTSRMWCIGFIVGRDAQYSEWEIREATYGAEILYAGRSVKP